MTALFLKNSFLGFIAAAEETCKIQALWIGTGYSRTLVFPNKMPPDSS